MSTLNHKEIYKDASRAAVELPLGEALAGLGAGATFPLMEDPRETDRALLIGMFVLRPAAKAWSASLSSNVPAGLREAEQWCFNVKGYDGGWLIAAGNPLDAYRLSLQYGLSDAVIVGSNTVVTEGLDHEGHEGYLWQPYGPAAWSQLATLDNKIGDKIADTRAAWQKLGVLSPRRYPAQIVVTQSGKLREGARDIFEARIFSAKHPDGAPVESYILTSEAGAERLRARAGKHQLNDAIDKILIATSPAGDPETLAIDTVPAILRKRLDIRIANHDGGRTVLSEFSSAGVLAQMNLTLMRGTPVKEILAQSDRVPDSARSELLENFESRRQLFFSGDNRLPAGLIPISVLHDGGDGVVVSFDARAQRGL